MKLIGIVGWKNSGKTTLVVELVRLFTAQGLNVATIKHAHHAFDLDQPGKDSYRHRDAGASEVIIASSTRWAHLHELRDEAEPELEDLLPRLGDVDLVIVEGFKRDAHDKIEVVAPDRTEPPIAEEDPYIIAIACETPAPDNLKVPALPRSEPARVADFIRSHLDL